MLELPCWGMLWHAKTCHVWQTRRKTLTRHKKLSVKHIQIQNDINSAPHLQVSWEHVMSKTTNIPSIYSPVWLSLCVDCLPATGLLTLTGSLFHRGISWARAAPVTVLSLLGWGTRRLQMAHCRGELPILTDAAVTAFVEFFMSFIKGLCAANKLWCNWYKFTGPLHAPDWHSR